MTRIVVAEDDTLLGALVATLFRSADDLELVCVAPDGASAIRATEEQKPDVLLLDVNLPVASGWEVLERVRASTPGMRVVMMSVHYSDQAVRRARAMGAAEYLDKRDAARCMHDVLRRVAAGEEWFQHRPIEARPAAKDLPGARRTDSLTDRERDVARCICEGRSNQEIASRLGISPHTAAAHVSHILLKLDAHNRTEAARIIVQRGLLGRR